MIRVTRLNGDKFVVNAEVIKFIEEMPDTVITLMTNEKILVKESMKEIIERAIEYGRALRVFPSP